MLKTRHREKLFLDACLQAKQSFVIDNTNPTKVNRQRYITSAKEYGFEVVGYYFQSKIEDCLQRNQFRLKGEKVPIAGVKATHAKLELPSYEEGFDKLYYVEPDNNGAFAVQEWNDEV
jgi:predicted kinase